MIPNQSQTIAAPTYTQNFRKKVSGEFRGKFSRYFDRLAS
jgi:hypothetical protein